MCVYGWLEKGNRNKKKEKRIQDRSQRCYTMCRAFTFIMNINHCMLWNKSMRYLTDFMFVLFWKFLSRFPQCSLHCSFVVQSVRPRNRPYKMCTSDWERKSNERWIVSVCVFFFQSVRLMKNIRQSQFDYVSLQFVN